MYIYFGYIRNDLYDRYLLFGNIRELYSSRILLSGVPELMYKTVYIHREFPIRLYISHNMFGKFRIVIT